MFKRPAGAAPGVGSPLRYPSLHSQLSSLLLGLLVCTLTAHTRAHTHTKARLEYHHPTLLLSVLHTAGDMGKEAHGSSNLAHWSPVAASSPLSHYKGMDMKKVKDMKSGARLPGFKPSSTINKLCKHRQPS